MSVCIPISDENNQQTLNFHQIKLFSLNPRLMNSRIEIRKSASTSTYVKDHYVCKTITLFHRATYNQNLPPKKRSPWEIYIHIGYDVTVSHIHKKYTWRNTTFIEVFLSE